MTKQLTDLAEKTVKVAERLGAEQAEVYIGSTRSFSIDVENNAIKSAAERRDAGCGIRCVFGKKIGFAYVTTLNGDDIENALRRSISLAKASVADPDFVSLPGPESRYPVVKDLFDKGVEGLTADEAADLIAGCLDAAKEPLHGRKYAIQADLSTSSGSRAIANSLGVSQSAESTSITMYSEVTIKEQADQTSSYEYLVSRALREINPEWIGRTASENALRNLGAKTIEGGDMSVIMTPLAVSMVVGSGFADAVNAEEVQQGRSYISDAIGSEVASDELHIVDDGLLKGGVGSRAFDAEGALSQRTQVLKRGVLRSLLHSSYTANKDRVPNTGNASRPSYAGIPMIATTNFVIEPGRGMLEDLVSEVKKGVLCMNTFDRPNMTTGDLSAMVSEGFYIEDGELRQGVKSTLIGINMRDLLKRVIRVGADTRATGRMVTPSIVIDSAKITSG
ncbi:MAG: hypothetical protein C4K47_06060 [Candidatus Thorarchaeota archaeon]|nr:MAG: hypothetical protein C4K47_06060 [Candidatus Thorarchaeota archaeon]